MLIILNVRCRSRILVGIPPHSEVETALYMLLSQGKPVESESKDKSDGENPSKRSNTPLDAGNESYWRQSTHQIGS